MSCFWRLILALSLQRGCWDADYAILDAMVFGNLTEGGMLVHEYHYSQLNAVKAFRLILIPIRLFEFLLQIFFFFIST